MVWGCLSRLDDGDLLGDVGTGAAATAEAVADALAVV